MKKVIAVMAVMFCMMLCSVAHANSVPALVNFQSVLFDDGGNPLPGGPASVVFRIKDVADQVLYEERQTVDVVGGAISVMVGNGLDVNGAPTGGIPIEMLDPTTAKYLDVIVDGYSPQATMEIVSVPYSLYSQKALGAEKGAIDGDAIKDGAIRAEHFDKDAIKEIGDTLAGGGGVVSVSQMQSTSGAQSIGVTPGFAYSGSLNLQGVLQDFDRAIAQRETKIETITTVVAQEVADRQAADNSLTAQINDQVSSHGDNMDGDLSVCGSVNVDSSCGGSIRYGQMDVPYSIQVNQNSITEARGFFGGLKVVAWGSVDISGSLVQGYNVQKTGPELRFLSSLSDANYLVLVTPTVASSTPSIAHADNKTTASFFVRTATVGGGYAGGGGVSYDFIVLDAQ